MIGIKSNQVIKDKQACPSWNAIEAVIDSFRDKVPVPFSRQKWTDSGRLGLNWGRLRHYCPVWRLGRALPASRATSG